MASDSPSERPHPRHRISFTPSPGFATWLRGTGGSLIFSTYQGNRLMVAGTDPNSGRLCVLERSFRRPMGIGVTTNAFWMAGLFQIWGFRNFLEPGQMQTVDGNGHDAVFVPVASHTTGELDTHDLHVWRGEPVFVATRFNCLATLSRTGSFAPWWRPRFVDALVGEDRCHLNGLAMRDSKPAYVSCVAETNGPGLWRERRKDGGVVIHVPSDEIVATGLSMPHSPRWHDGRIYLLQSGSGEFGTIDPADGIFRTLCFLPGFARGLAIVGEHAVIGVSCPRENRGFTGLPLEETLRERGVSPICQLVVVHLATGEIAHWLQLGTPVSELYDVVHLPDHRNPLVVDFQQEAIRSFVRPSTP